MVSTYTIQRSSVNPELHLCDTSQSVTGLQILPVGRVDNEFVGGIGWHTGENAPSRRGCSQPFCRGGNGGVVRCVWNSYGWIPGALLFICDRRLDACPSRSDSPEDRGHC